MYFFNSFMVADTYKVQITVDGCVYAPSLCPYNRLLDPEACLFKATLDRTPTVTSVTPASGPAREYISKNAIYMFGTV